MNAPILPPGILRVRPGPGANCSSAGSAIDILFYGSVFVGMVAVALAAVMSPESAPPPPSGEDGERRDDDPQRGEKRSE